METALITLLTINALAILVLLLSVMRLNKKMRTAFSGKDARDLEGVIMRLVQDTTEAKKMLRLLGEHLETVERRGFINTKRPHVTRYNAFPDIGDNQSFSTAFLDEHGNGVIISSLYGRDRNSLYAKPVEAFVSPYELTDEEGTLLKKIQQSG